mmetsp:Transcript_55794/g.122215  ORF Transcript_55794/g.122215 Transcript_55794/m.122215 type:complete len:233 (-) Transcript_55794:1131-1829(-)
MPRLNPSCSDCVTFMPSCWSAKNLARWDSTWSTLSHWGICVIRPRFSTITLTTPELARYPGTTCVTSSVKLCTVGTLWMIGIASCAMLIWIFSLQRIYWTRQTSCRTRTERRTGRSCIVRCLVGMSGIWTISSVCLLRPPRCLACIPMPRSTTGPGSARIYLSACWCCSRGSLVRSLRVRRQSRGSVVLRSIALTFLTKSEMSSCLWMILLVPWRTKTGAPTSLSSCKNANI